jgi:SRSO17 transposase
MATIPSCARGKRYVAGIQPQTLVWKPGKRPSLAPKKGHRDASDTISVKDLALGLRARAWRTIQWREGSNEWLSSRFARLLVHVASGHERAGKPTKDWLPIEWPEGEKEPTKYWLSTLPSSITFCDLVDAAKLRWRIERDYQELKQEVGLGHYEGRGWRGFHHDATMCIAAYGFLISETETIPLRTSSRRAVPATCRSRLLPTPRILHCGLSATSQTRSPPCADASSTLSSDACHDAHAVAPQLRDAPV